MEMTLGRKNVESCIGGDLKTVFPMIEFKKGQWTRSAKRAVRIYQGKICVSSEGKLWEVVPKNTRVCACNQDQEPLYDFGSTGAAKAMAQTIASAATLERLRRPRDASMFEPTTRSSIADRSGYSVRPSHESEPNFVSLME